MKYDPRDASMCLPAGEYDATLTDVVDTDKEGQPLVSGNSGEDMEKIVYTVYSDSGERRLFDYITASVTAWKYSQIAEAIGQRPDFDAGKFDPRNAKGENIRLVLAVEKYEGRDQNKIKKVLPKGAPSTSSRVTAPRQAQPSHARKEIAPEDIPF